MGFKKGQPKPENSGKKKGQPNRKTLARKYLEEAFDEAGLDFGATLAGAIKDRDIEFIDSLVGVAPYVFAKLAPRQPEGQQSPVFALAQLLSTPSLVGIEDAAEGDE